MYNFVGFDMMKMEQSKWSTVLGSDLEKQMIKIEKQECM